MAIINCPECGKKISEYAERCPSCGLPQDKFIKDKQIGVQEKEETTKVTKTRKSINKKVVFLMAFLLFTIIVATILLISDDDEIAMSFKVNNKYGLIDLNGNILIEPKMEYLGTFFDGLTPASNEDGKVGFINKRGDFIIKPIFDFASSFYSSANAAVVMINGLWGAIDRKGDFIVQPLHELAKTIPKSNEYFMFMKNGKYALFRKNVRITDYVFDEGHGNFDESRYIVAKKEGKLGVIDLEGNTIIDFKYNSLTIPSKSESNFVVFKKDFKTGVLNKKGEEVLPAGLYDFISSFSNGRAFAKKGEDIYLLDENHKIIKTLKHGLEFYYWGNKNVVVYKDDKFGLIDYNGEIIFEPKYEEIEPIENGKYLVKVNGSYGVFNEKEEYIIPPIYSKLYGTIDFSDMIYFLGTAFKKHGKDLYGMIDDKILKNLEKAGQNLTIECYDEFLKLLSALSVDVVKKENEEKILKNLKGFAEECTNSY